MKHRTEDKSVVVVHSDDTKKIILPSDMGFKDAMEWLARKEEEDQRKVKIHEYVDAYPLDGALALSRAMAEIYGWTNLVPTPGFFGEEPPGMVGVRTGPNPEDVIQVPWGRFNIPGIAGYIQTGMSLRNGRPVFTIGGVVKRKHEKEIAKIATLTREFVRKASIYRGKAIRVHFPDVSQDPPPSPDDFNPAFLDLSNVKPEELVFSDETYQLIRTNLFTPIERTQQCRDHQIPLKRGVLLAGDYGVGKTLTAYVAARKCEENGWTFIYLDSVQDLGKAIYFAQQYAPAMIFAEDIDRVLAGNDRGEAVNTILNTIDGVDTKHSELIVALTTNHIDRINQAMLRPGRLDAVISVGPPDAEAAIKLVRQYGRGLVSETADLEEVGKELSGRIPAVIREVIERAKLGAVSRVDSSETLVIQPEDLLVAVTSMLKHLELLKPQAEDKRSDIEKAAGVLAQSLESNGVPSKDQDRENGKSPASRSQRA